MAILWLIPPLIGFIYGCILVGRIFERIHLGPIQQPQPKLKPIITITGRKFRDAR